MHFVGYCILLCQNILHTWMSIKFIQQGTSARIRDGEVNDLSITQDLRYNM